MEIVLLVTLIGCLIGVLCCLITLPEMGRYRWATDIHHGPAPLFGVVVRPRGYSWVRVEIVVGGRAFWLHWGE
jgi:hypothetical protein